MREPYAERFRLILNDLGAGFAARGDELDKIVERANPALRQTDRVLALLAGQNRALAQLARDSDTVLAPLARERRAVAGFINNANTTAQATAERSADLEAGLERFPGYLRELAPDDGRAAQALRPGHARDLRLRQRGARAHPRPAQSRPVRRGRDSGAPER